jgi:hypothetical protein
MKFYLVADEAWTHDHTPPLRYFNFFGGVFCNETEYMRLTQIINDIKLAHKIHKEVKWKSLRDHNNDAYVEIINVFIDYLQNHKVKYRQMFSDRRDEHPDPADSAEKAIQVQFKQYYQFLKNAFAFEHLPPGPHEIIILLDTHTHQQEKRTLEEYVAKLPSILDRTDIQLNLFWVKSSANSVLQAADLCMGAAGWYGNRQHEFRALGQWGMTARQKLKRRFAKHIYNKLRETDALHRGSKAFNWFESTGGRGVDKGHSQALRIWKFVPKESIRNKSWENDNRLGKF